MYKFEKIILASLIMCGVITFLLFLYDGVGVFNSTNSELVGFILQAIVMVILFNRLQKLEKKEALDKQKKDLKDTLRTEVALYLKWANLIDVKASNREFVFSSDTNMVKEMIDTLQTKSNIEDKSIQLSFIKNFSGKRLPSITAQLPTSAGINSSHSRLWSTIINSINMVTISKTDKEAFNAFINLLTNIEKFDRLKI